MAWNFAVYLEIKLAYPRSQHTYEHTHRSQQNVKLQVFFSFFRNTLMQLLHSQNSIFEVNICYTVYLEYELVYN